jgi:Flp pilus assembly protein TadD
VEAQPDAADARYLTGKILLAQARSAEAVVHLEAAVRLAPDDSSARYQLGQAYQKLGRADDAQRQFDEFRRLKDEKR